MSESVPHNSHWQEVVPRGVVQGLGEGAVLHGFPENWVNTYRNHPDVLHTDTHHEGLPTVAVENVAVEPQPVEQFPVRPDDN